MSFRRVAAIIPAARWLGILALLAVLAMALPAGTPPVEGAAAPAVASVDRFWLGQPYRALWPSGPAGQTQSRLPQGELAAPEPGQGVLYQVATLNALMEGSYDGTVAVGELRRHGDFGIGTFDQLDGEMVMLGGKVFQIKVDGTILPVTDTVKTPFAAVTRFQADKALALTEPVAWSEIAENLDYILPTVNIPYAIKIEGQFDYIKARSVPPQSRPYPKLTEVVANQATFELEGVKGTMVGFRVPAYMDGVNMPGYHLHFLSEDRRAGGHLLEAQIAGGKLEIGYLHGFQMELPRGGDFYQVDLRPNKDREKDLEKVER